MNSTADLITNATSSFTNDYGLTVEYYCPPRGLPQVKTLQEARGRNIRPAYAFLGLYEDAAQQIQLGQPVATSPEANGGLDVPDGADGSIPVPVEERPTLSVSRLANTGYIQFTITRSSTSLPDNSTNITDALRVTYSLAGTDVANQKYEVPSGVAYYSGRHGEHYSYDKSAGGS